MTTCRIDTPVEIEYYRNGGILHTVLRRLSRRLAGPGRAGTAGPPRPGAGLSRAARGGPGSRPDTGSVSTKRAPRSESAISSVPALSSASWREMASPSPLPPVSRRVVKWV